MSADLVQLVTDLAQRARAASLALATVPTAAKDAALRKLADLIDASHPALHAANARDHAGAGRIFNALFVEVHGVGGQRRQL